MLKFGKNSAGKERLMLTITGSIVVLVVAWITGTLLMPERNAETDVSKVEGMWNCTTDSGHKSLKIKSSGYFYYDEVLKNGKSMQYKGVITTTIKDTIELLSFNLDTILYHKILSRSNKKLRLQGINDSVEIIFTKEE